MHDDRDLEATTWHVEVTEAGRERTVFADGSYVLGWRPRGATLEAARGGPDEGKSPGP